MHGKRPTRSLLVLACTAVLSRCPVSTSRCTSGLLQTAHDRRHQARGKLPFPSTYTAPKSYSPFPSPQSPIPPSIPSHPITLSPPLPSPHRRHAPAPRLRNFLSSTPRPSPFCASPCFGKAPLPPFHPFDSHPPSTSYPSRPLYFFLSLTSQLEISSRSPVSSHSILSLCLFVLSACCASLSFSVRHLSSRGNDHKKKTFDHAVCSDQLAPNSHPIILALPMSRLQ
ncbi:hypothetical protein QBC41DRAFT_157508 [Cercophora samala]|uniref:Uncharacterized protein n=1 Tax=Cercophora samala TaxID=330535 RepID=A0AA39Z871_9PEZI|nr:hypothetical protein QBC41DRAFT_157508 [Cercophora samala]